MVITMKKIIAIMLIIGIPLTICAFTSGHNVVCPRCNNPYTLHLDR
jgi:hypothetical protein